MLPGLHGVQSVLPLLFTKRPVGQALQLTWAEDTLKEPLSQLRHATLASEVLRNLPGRQSAHAELLVREV